MKRGFLNKTKTQQKATTQKVIAQETTGGEIGSTNANETALPDVQIVAFNPSYFSEVFQEPICIARTQPLNTTMHPSSLICTRVPSTSTDKYGTTTCVLYARDQAQLLNTPGYPSSPTPFDYAEPAAYEIRDTQSTGKAMFATRALNTGDLIFVERPLIVVPVNADLSAIGACPEILRNMTRIIELQGTTGSTVGILEAVLEVAFARMSKEHQKSFMELANAHTSDGTPKLTAFWRTNVFGVKNLGEKDYQYGAILNKMSRINHSCRANCANSFQRASFSFELRATKSIAAGEEIFYSYSPDMNTSTTERQAQLRPYGFVCSCISCRPSPTHSASDAIRTSVSSRIQSLCDRYKKFDGTTGTKDRKSALKIYEDNVSLLRDIRQEGMDGYEWYREAMELHIMLCTALVSTSKSGPEGARWLDEAKRYIDKLMKFNVAMDGSTHLSYRESQGRL